LNADYCVLFSTAVRVGVRVRVRVGVRIRSSVWLISGYEHAFVILSVAIVTLPI